MAKKDITVIGGDGWGYQTIPATGGGGEVFHDYTLVGKGTETDDLGVDVLPSDELTQSKVIDNLYAGMTISN
jgi:hypothetical protein